MEWGWGVVVAVNRATSSRAMARGTQPSADAVGGAAAGYTVDTLLKCSKQHAGTLGMMVFYFRVCFVFVCMRTRERERE